MDASYIRANARESLQGNWKNAVLTAFLAAILGGLLVNFGSFSIDIGDEYLTKSPAIFKILVACVGGIASSISIVHFVLGGVIQLGYAQYLLKQYDRESHDHKELFTQFNRFKQGFLQAFLRGLYTALWTLLFIIPGIIKAFSYAMTPFIMAENPEMTAKEAITASKELMDGHKWELFVLNLTFIGWGILCLLTCGIGFFFLNPYINAAHAAFYRRLRPKKRLQEPVYFASEPCAAE